MFPLQYVGMALATSIASWLNVILMARTLKARGWLMIEDQLFAQIAKMLLSCALMALVLWIVSPYLMPYMARNADSFGRFAALIILACVGGAVYLLLSFAMNILQSRTAVIKRFRKL